MLNKDLNVSVQALNPGLDHYTLQHAQMGVCVREHWAYARGTGESGNEWI